MEGIIQQSEKLSVLHPQSVNTIRIVTFRYNDGHIDCKYPCLRMGIGNSIVDNAGAGGIFGAVDIETGRIGVADELEHFYNEHPDTHIQFKNFYVLEFDAAKKLSVKLATMIPENRYCSWDLALSSDDEWLLVEANSNGQLIWQIAANKGLRYELETIVSRMI